WPPIKDSERGALKGTRRRGQEPVSLHDDKGRSSPRRRRERWPAADERCSDSGCLRAAPHRLEKNFKICALGHECGRAAALGLAGDILAEGDPAEDDDPQRRQGLSQLLDQRQATAPLQHEIEDQGIGLRAAYRGEHVASVSYLPDTAHVRLGIDQLAHDVAEIAVVFRDEHSQALFVLQRVFLRKGRWAGRATQIACPAQAPANQASMRRRSSSVFSRISVSLPRLSTFRRTSGSVLEPRRLNRHCGNSIESPSVKSTASAPRSYCCRALVRIDFASDLRFRLISPLIGKSRIRSPTSA